MSLRISGNYGSAEGVIPLALSPSKTVHSWFWIGVWFCWSTIKTIKHSVYKFTRFGVNWLKLLSRIKVKRDQSVPVVSY